MNQIQFSIFHNLWQERPRLFNNPVIKRELIERLRKKSSMLFLFLFLLLMAFMTLSAWDNYLNTYFYTTTHQQLSYFLYLTIFQAFFLFFMLPIISATCINIEFEQESWELLKTTHLSTASVLLAKFLNCLIFIVFLQLALIPFYGVYFLSGGISPNDIFVVFALLFEGTTVVILIGMVCSAYFRRTIRSITATYLLSGLYFTYPFIIALIMNTNNINRNDFLEALLMVQSPLLVAVKYFGGPANMRNIFLPGNSIYYAHTLFIIVIVASLIYLCFKLIQRKSTYTQFSLLAWLGVQSKNSQYNQKDWTEYVKLIPDFYNPILHKENKELNRFISWRNIIIPACLFMFGLFILWVFVYEDPYPDMEGFIIFIFIVLPILCIPYSIYAYRSEIDQNSWELLRTTTLPLEHIMAGKLNAAQKMFRIRFLSFYLVLFIVGFFYELVQYSRQSMSFRILLDTSPDHNYMVYHLVFFVLAFIWAYFLFNVGMYVSLRLKKTLTAYVTMVLFVLAFYFFPLPLIIFFDNAGISDEIISASSLFSPIFYFIYFWEANELISWLLVGTIHVIIMFGSSLLLLKRIRYRLSKIE